MIKLINLDTGEEQTFETIYDIWLKTNIKLKDMYKFLDDKSQDVVEDCHNNQYLIKIIEE